MYHESDLLVGRSRNLLRDADTVLAAPAIPPPNCEVLAQIALRRRQNQHVIGATIAFMVTTIVVTIASFSARPFPTNPSLAATPVRDSVPVMPTAAGGEDALLAEVRALRREFEQQLEAAVAVGRRIDDLCASDPTRHPEMVVERAAVELWSIASVTAAENGSTQAVAQQCQSICQHYPGTHGARLASRWLVENHP